MSLVLLAKAWLVGFVIVACVTSAIAAVFTRTVKTNAPLRPPIRWLPIDHRKDGRDR